MSETASKREHDGPERQHKDRRAFASDTSSSNHSNQNAVEQDKDAATSSTASTTMGADTKNDDFRTVISSRRRGLMQGGGRGPRNQPKHPLQFGYSFWYFRKPAPSSIASMGSLKPNEAYERGLKKIGDFNTVEDFWGFYTHLYRPSDLAIPSDYHLFKQGIKPMWEDEKNRLGGKWTVRLKKGFVDRFWEDLLLALIGNIFDDDICGVVVSVREYDSISIWNSDAQDKELCDTIRDALTKVLRLPPTTAMEYKVHDESLNSLIQYQKQREQELSSEGTTNSTANDSITTADDNDGKQATRTEEEHTV